MLQINSGSQQIAVDLLMEIILVNLSPIIPSVFSACSQKPITAANTSSPKIEEERRLLILNIYIYSGNTAWQKKKQHISLTCWHELWWSDDASTKSNNHVIFMQYLVSTFKSLRVLLSCSHLHRFSAYSHTDSRGETADADALTDHELSPCFSLKCLSCICAVLLNCFNLKSLSASSCLLHATSRWQFGGFTAFVGSPLWSVVVARCGCHASSDGTVVRMKLQAWNTLKVLSWADLGLADIL